MGFALEIFFALRAGIGFATHASVSFDATANGGGNPQALATVLFTRYFFPFEVTSLLLIVAAVAAMVLANRRARAVTQAEMDAAHAAEEPAEGAGAVRTPIAYFLLLSGILFAMGTVGVLVRKNALLIFMSVELQLNAVNLSLVAFSRMHGNLDGQVLAFFSMVVAAAEVVVGLAIIVAVFRRVQSVNVDDARSLGGDHRHAAHLVRAADPAGGGHDQPVPRPAPGALAGWLGGGRDGAVVPGGRRRRDRPALGAARLAPATCSTCSTGSASGRSTWARTCAWIRSRPR